LGFDELKEIRGTSPEVLITKLALLCRVIILLIPLAVRNVQPVPAAINSAWRMILW